MALTLFSLLHPSSTPLLFPEVKATERFVFALLDSVLYALPRDVQTAAPAGTPEADVLGSD